MFRIVCWTIYSIKMNKEYRLRMKAKGSGVWSSVKGGLEVRPGGMLVQQRSSDSNQNSRNIQVRVKYGSSYHQLIISSHASFGELKKMVAGITGVQQAEDQKVIYKGKERESKCYVDMCGVKDGSMIVVVEDELSRERPRKDVDMDKASKEIAAIRFEVDNLAKQVTSTEVEINAGKKVVETVLLNLIELLMTQLIKLDGISADGDVKLQRRLQVKRVQKYIETLDMLKMKNSSLDKVPLQQQRHRVFCGSGSGEFSTTEELQ